VPAVVAVLAAAAVPAHARPTPGYLSSPTEQVGVPGFAASGQLTPEGNLYTGWAEYALRFGRRLRAWDQPTRTLPNPSEPRTLAVLSDGGVRYTQEVFAVAVAGAPVAYLTVTATNTSRRVARARAGLRLFYSRGRPVRSSMNGRFVGSFRFPRPQSTTGDGMFMQPGEAFDPGWVYTAAGRDIVRGSRLLVRGPGRVARVGVPGVAAIAAPHTAGTYARQLRPGGRVSWTWQVPLDPPVADARADAALDAMPLAAARAELSRLWAEQQDGMMQIDVPERKISDTYRAAVAQMLQSRYHTPSGWVQAVNKLQYQAFWIRDAAIMTQALDLVGLHGATAENLQFLTRWQRDDGLFISRAGQYDGLGQALWVLAEHARLTGNDDYCVAQLRRMDDAVDWLERTSAADPLGLLPSGDPRDNELAAGHITGDNLWAAAGLRSAIACAREAGHAKQASQWEVVRARFEAALRAALALAVTRDGHIPPVLDAPGGEDWGNYWAAYPVAVLDPADPWVTATRAWAHSRFAEGLATYRGGRTLHAYLGFKILQTDLAAGNPLAAVRGLYAAAAHTTSTHGGWETSVRVYGDRRARQNLAPHGTFSAEYVALLRNLLVSETADGGVTLATGASPAWLAPGRRITVADAPVGRGGLISYTLTGERGGALLQWRSDLPAGTALTWTLPPWAVAPRTAAGPVGPRVALPGPEGAIRVTWSGRPPALSYKRTAAWLVGAYRAHGKRPPFTRR
jgi:hypothetical protein